MQINLTSKPARIIVMVIAVAVFVGLCVWVSRAYFATLMAETLTAQNLHAASRLDPGDYAYAEELGRVYQYSVTDAKPQRAIQQFTRAVELNPYDPLAWLDLGTAFEFQGKAKKAEACLRRVDELAPRIPRYQWAIANFYLLHNNVDEAFRHFKMVLEGDPGYGAEIYRTAWNASGDTSQILAELVPDDARTNLDYLNFLLSTHRLDQTAPVWARIADSPEKFDPASASPYIDALIHSHKTEEAYRAWSVLRAKGLIPATDEATTQNLIENGDFENQPMNIGFDWRIGAVSGIYVGLDDSTFHSPAHSLLIQFPGTLNFYYQNIWQLVPVLPDHSYHLLAFMKAQGITTDSGPRIEVRDAFKASLLDKFTDQLTGNSPAWMPLSLDFKTGPKTTLLSIIIARLPSQMLDNRIAGRVWVDDVSLTPAGIEAP
ncbi:MAG: tetratricopeptide repeat protein [Terriglobia bacterium]